MSSQHRASSIRRTRRFLSITAAALTAALALSACGSEEPATAGGSGSSGSGAADGDFGFEAAEQNSDPITVWVDATREPAATAFQKAHPEVPIVVETYDGGADGSGSFQTKISAFDQAGEGWPDVVWSTQNNDATWASQGQTPFAAPLDKGLLEQSFLDGFAPGALAPVTIDGTVYGLRNDLSQNMLWYDQSLLDQFGYELPTTWEEYEELGVKLGAEHPGYIVGSVGDSWTSEVFFWGAKAPVNNVTGVDTLTVDTSDPKSVAMAGILDTLLAAGTMAQDSVFSADFVSKYTGKVVMMPGPIWYSGAIFQNPDSLNAAPGTIGAGLPLAWEGEDAVTGNVGGGTWFISRHSTNLAAAETFAEFVTSADEYQVALAPGYPAYSAAATEWLAKQSESGFFAGDFEKNVTAAAAQVWDGWGYPSFSQESIWAKTITPQLAAGEKLTDLLPEWQTAIVNEAQVNGYTVN